MDSSESSMTLLTLFKMGGVFMWPLLAFSIATVSITLERIIFILHSNLRLDDIKEQLIKFIGNKDFDRARNFLLEKKQKRLGARVLFALFEFPELRGSRLELEANAETEASDCVASLENGFDYLTALGSLAPVTGFLGTVSGMIGAFKSIAEATEVNAQIVANGIYEALITTVFGLIIAIIAMTAGSILAHVVDGFSNDVETSCSQIIKMLK
jgi:biopolymer transport protein ExbB